VAHPLRSRDHRSFERPQIYPMSTLRTSGESPAVSVHASSGSALLHNLCKPLELDREAFIRQHGNYSLVPTLRP
jgi:hypothetical protein